jgi:hypothetical protein
MDSRIQERLYESFREAAGTERKSGGENGGTGEEDLISPQSEEGGGEVARGEAQEPDTAAAEGQQAPQAEVEPIGTLESEISQLYAPASPAPAGGAGIDAGARTAGDVSSQDGQAVGSDILDYGGGMAALSEAFANASGAGALAASPADAASGGGGGSQGADADGGTAASIGAGSFAATPAGTSAKGGSTSTSQDTSGDGSTAESVVTTFLESGFGMASLISGLFGLFGGGAAAPPALEKYQMPSAIQFASADTGDTLSAADYDQMGQLRLYAPSGDENPQAGGPVAAGMNGAAPGLAASGLAASGLAASGLAASGLAAPGLAASGPAASGPAAFGQAASWQATSGQTVAGQAVPGQAASSNSTAGPQITVNVQAMDAQSFLDRSDDLAKAVRAAMLNMSSINDVVNEL